PFRRHAVCERPAVGRTTRAGEAVVRRTRARRRCRAVSRGPRPVAGAGQRGPSGGAQGAPAVSGPTVDSDDAGRRVIDGREVLAAARLQLLAAARHRLALHLPLLGREDYGNDAELAELKRIATSGRRADIRIL